MTHSAQLEIATPGRGFTDISDEVRGVVRRAGVGDGLCTVFVHHTSASLIITENADPQVRRDLEAWMAGAVRDGDPLFRHTAEGPDDMPAHVRSVLTASSVAVPVVAAELALGTWQGIFLWEHRHRGHRRRVTVVIVGGADAAIGS